jgi:hypothetical protein
MKAESCQIFKKIKIPNFMKTHPMGSELFQADGRTDKMKPRRFPQFCERA